MRGSVRITLAVLGISMATAPRASAQEGTTPGSRLNPGRFSVGVSLDAGYYWHFKDAVGSQQHIVDYSSNELTLGVGGSLEWTPLDRLTFGVGVHYNPHTFDQQFNSPDPLAPTSVSGTVHSWMVDGYVAPQVHLGPLKVGIPFGMTWANDTARLREEFLGGVQERIERDLQTWKARTGVQLDVPMSGGFTARVGLDLISSFKHQDADANARVRFGTWFQF